MKRTFKLETELRELADLHSRYVHVRTMNGGNSHDDVRKATKKQRETLYGILYGALLGLNYGETVRMKTECARAVIDAAEFQADILMRPLLRAGEEFQGYLGVYIPLTRILDKWETE